MYAALASGEPEKLDYVGSEVNGGDVVVLGDTVAFARHHIDANVPGHLWIGAVWDLPKETGTAHAKGDVVYWDATNHRVTKTSTGNKALGIAAAAAAAAAAKGKYLSMPTGAGGGGGGGAVDSVFGRTGDVVATAGDYGVADVTGAAPLDSPAFTGNPTAPTQSQGDGSEAIATTDYVDTAVGGAGGAATIPYLVAANDAPAAIKAIADATCDGTADDVQIQAAIDAVTAKGGRVQLTQGTFSLAATVNLAAGVELSGSGSKTILSSGSNNVKLTGDRASLAYLKVAGTVEIETGDGMNVRGVDVDATGRDYGVYVHVATAGDTGYLTFDHVTARNATKHGFYLIDLANQLVEFERCVAEDNTLDGFHFDGGAGGDANHWSQYGGFRGCSACHNSRYGIYTGFILGPRIFGCTVAWNGVANVWCDSPALALISGNEIEESGVPGVVLNMLDGATANIDSVTHAAFADTIPRYCQVTNNSLDHCDVAVWVRNPSMLPCTLLISGNNCYDQSSGYGNATGVLVENLVDNSKAYSASASYAIGDWVVYQGLPYRCKTACGPESWTAGHWDLYEKSITITGNKFYLANAVKITQEGAAANARSVHVMGNSQSSGGAAGLLLNYAMDIWGAQNVIVDGNAVAATYSWLRLGHGATVIEGLNTRLSCTYDSEVDPQPTAWAAGAHSVGEYRSYTDGLVYRCILAVSAPGTTDPATDTTHWTKTQAYLTPNWVSGAAYVIGDWCVSPGDSAVYRCTAAVTGTTDPKDDGSHWTQQSVARSPLPSALLLSGQVDVLGTANAAASVLKLGINPTYGMPAIMMDHSGYGRIMLDCYHGHFRVGWAGGGNNGVGIDYDPATGITLPPIVGTPTAPTAAQGTNTTQLATTAFVLANAGVTDVRAGTTSFIAQVFIADSSKTDGSGLTGLDDTKVVLYYKRNTGAAAVAVTLDASSGVTLGTYEPSVNTHGAIKEVDATHMPGVYEVHVPNNALAAGAQNVVLMLTDAGSNNVTPTPLRLVLS